MVFTPEWRQELGRQRFAGDAAHLAQVCSAIMPSRDALAPWPAALSCCDVRIGAAFDRLRWCRRGLWLVAPASDRGVASPTLQPAKQCTRKPLSPSDRRAKADVVMRRTRNEIIAAARRLAPRQAVLRCGRRWSSSPHCCRSRRDARLNCTFRRHVAQGSLDNRGGGDPLASEPAHDDARSRARTRLSIQESISDSSHPTVRSPSGIAFGKLPEAMAA